MKTQFSRDEKILARKLLADPDAFASALIERSWADLAPTVAFAETEVASDLAATDPALYRQTRNHITHFYLLGGGSLSFENTRKLAKTSQLSNE